MSNEVEPTKIRDKKKSPTDTNATPKSKLSGRQDGKLLVAMMAHQDPVSEHSRTGSEMLPEDASRTPSQDDLQSEKNRLNTHEKRKRSDFEEGGPSEKRKRSDLAEKRFADHDKRKEQEVFSTPESKQRLQRYLAYELPGESYSRLQQGAKDHNMSVTDFYIELQKFASQNESLFGKLLHKRYGIPTLKQDGGTNGQYGYPPYSGGEIPEQSQPQQYPMDQYGYPPQTNPQAGYGTAQQQGQAAQQQWQWNPHQNRYEYPQQPAAPAADAQGQPQSYAGTGQQYYAGTGQQQGDSRYNQPQQTGYEQPAPPQSYAGTEQQGQQTNPQAEYGTGAQYYAGTEQQGQQTNPQAEYGTGAQYNTGTAQQQHYTGTAQQQHYTGTAQQQHYTGTAQQGQLIGQYDRPIQAGESGIEEITTQGAEALSHGIGYGPRLDQQNRYHMSRQEESEQTLLTEMQRQVTDLEQRYAAEQYTDPDSAELIKEHLDDARESERMMRERIQRQQLGQYQPAPYRL